MCNLTKEEKASLSRLASLFKAMHIKFSKGDLKQGRRWRIKKCGSISFEELKYAFGYYLDQKPIAELTEFFKEDDL